MILFYKLICKYGNKNHDYLQIHLSILIRVLLAIVFMDTNVHISSEFALKGNFMNKNYVVHMYGDMYMLYIIHIKFTWYRRCAFV